MMDFFQAMQPELVTIEYTRRVVDARGFALLRAAVGVLAVSILVLTVGCEHPGSRSISAVEIRGVVHQAGARLVSGAVLRGDREIVVDRGRAIIEIDGVGEIKIFSNTRCAVKRRQRQTSLRLVAGRVWAKISRLGSEHRFEVETANAVAGVRGTEFVVETDRETTDVRVIEGEVAVASSNEPQAAQVVRAGEHSTVRGRNRPSKPESYDSGADERLWQELKELFEEVKDLARDTARAVDEKVRETAPKVKEGAKEGAKKLREGMKDVFDK